MENYNKNSEIGIEVKITDRCNQLCFHCMNNDSSDGGSDLDLDLFLKKFSDWIADSRQMGTRIRELRVTGGEPLLMVGGVKKLARMCRSASIPCGINTNATLLTPDVAGELKSNGLEIVKISLDAADESLIRKMRGERASLQKVLAGIKNAVQKDFYVILRFTLCEFNKDQLLPCYEIGRDLGVDKFQVKPLIPAGRGFTSSAFLGPAEISACLDQLKEKITPHSPQLEILCWIPETIEDRGAKVCGSIDKVYIKTNFEVITCNYLSEAAPIGNMLADSFADIYSKRLASNIMNDKGINMLAKCPQLAHP